MGFSVSSDKVCTVAYLTEMSSTAALAEVLMTPMAWEALVAREKQVTSDTPAAQKTLVERGLGSAIGLSFGSSVSQEQGQTRTHHPALDPLVMATRGTQEAGGVVVGSELLESRKVMEGHRVPET